MKRLVKGLATAAALSAAAVAGLWVGQTGLLKLPLEPEAATAASPPQATGPVIYYRDPSGKPLYSLGKLFKKSIIIGCIVRNNDVIIPEGNTTIEEGDEVIVLCHKKQIPLVSRWFRARLKLYSSSAARRSPESSSE